MPEWVRRGASGASVFELQAALAARGFDVGAIDGEFGKNTDAALRAFQAAHGLVADGVAGPATWREIQAVRARGGEESAGVIDDLLHRGRADGRVQATIAEAVKDIGKGEDPLGSNAGPQISHLVDGYRDHWKYADRTKRDPWCAMAVSWWIRRGCGATSWKATPMGDWFGGSAQWKAWAVEHKVWGRFPHPGSVLVVADSEGIPRHVGLVAYYDATADLVVSIEGNVSDRVTVMERKPSTVAGFISWWAAE